MTRLQHSIIYLIGFVSFLHYDAVLSFSVVQKQERHYRITQQQHQPMESTNRYLLPSSSSLYSSQSTEGSTSGVQSLSFESLGSNHTAIADDLALSVQTMLDQEWMPQHIHMLMGQSVKESYIKVRTSDTVDTDDIIMTILTTVADDLTENWSIYDKDAFVNAWDIANYVSDYLTTRINNSTTDCACTLKIY